jgi:hypothetical protein
MNITPTQAPIDFRPAYLFRCGDSNLCAITRDDAGKNLPKHECEDGWRLLQGFSLGVQEPVPASVDPEKVMAALDARGFYIWYDMSISLGKARR